MNLRDVAILDGDDVARLLPHGDLVDALAEGHRGEPSTSRRVVFGPEGSDEAFLGLPAWQPGEAIGVKLVTVFPANPAAGRPSVQAVYVLFDGSTGDPVALIDGTELTYRKTAADSGLGARFLAREDATTLLMVGAGGLARHLIAAHLAIRPSLERVLVWNRTRSKAEAVAAAVGAGAVVVDSLADAVPEAGVISTATMTAEPLVEGRWLRPGTHLDLVGAFRPDHREVDDEAVLRAELYVDHREAPLTEGGDLAIPLAAGRITAADVRADLYELCRGEVPGRTDPDAITLFKNGGGGHLDLMTASFLWRRAASEGFVSTEGLRRGSPAANPRMHS
jgi:ornithine cyclodeaminase/alanine dehydrogenase-like protein (mu-crystallin family)